MAVIKCYLTSCKYNTALTIDDVKREQYCTKDEICIDLNEQASDFTCVAFESGGKRAMAPEGIKLDTFDDEEDI